MDKTIRHFQEELEALLARLLEMGGLAEERVRDAVQGLATRDAALIESGPTRLLFTRPAQQLTEDYITGRFG